MMDQPTYEQSCQILGAVYTDSFLRLQFLESENKKLRESMRTTLEASRQEIDRLREELEEAKKWKPTKENFKLPESLVGERD